MSHQFICLKSTGRVYLDHNATTPLATELASQIQQWVLQWGNPSSIHFDGRGPKSLLRESRQSMAKMIGADPLELIFTSGGSEANNLALKGVFESLFFSQVKGSSLLDRPRILVSAVEHPSVRNTLEFLKQKGASVELIPISREGRVDLEAYAQQLNERVALVSMMYANNETGNIFPIQKMAKLAHEKGALFHCDAVQALGKATVDVRKWEVDLASFSAHKFYALKGAGVLYSKKGVHLESLIHGGGQERGRRAGTENVLSLASLGWMAQFGDQIETRAGEMKQLRDKLEMQILSIIPDTKITGIEGKRLANTSCILISGVDGESLLMNLDLKGISVSTGAACSAGNTEPSPTLLAMGLTRFEAQSSLRVSLGWGTTQEELDRFLEVLQAVVVRLRSLQNRSQVIRRV